MPFAPPLTDKAGRGALCARIDALAKDFMRHRARGEYHEMKQVERRLDQARADFHRLYQKPLPPREHPGLEDRP